MTGSVRTHAKTEVRFTLYCFFENKIHFYPIILVNTKTTIPLELVTNTYYIPQCFASLYTCSIHHCSPPLWG